MNKLLLGLVAFAAAVFIACSGGSTGGNDVTVAPTVAPTAAPTVAPTAAPTVAPTAAPTVAPAGWTDEQKAQFVATWRVGEELFLSELNPYVVADLPPTTDEDIACYAAELEAVYPADAAKVISEMWIDDPNDDTPGIKDTISDALSIAMARCP